MPTVLVTGCDTGIGREFARQYLRDEWQVIATYRDIANQLDPTAGLRNRQLDVTAAADFEALNDDLGDEPIDLVISNAGIGLDTGKLGSLDYGYVRSMCEVNTIGPLRLVETFVDNLAASSLRRLATVTSRMGSIGLNISGGHYGYRASKAGLNAIMRSLAIDLFPRGITVISMHPGWVDTPGGGGNAAIPVADSVQSMRDLIGRRGNHETGQIYNYDGTPLTW